MWLIIGAGKSGLAAAKYLSSKGQTVRLCDGKTIVDSTKAALTSMNVMYQENSEDSSLLKDVRQLVLSPGVNPETNPLVVQGVRMGLPLSSEVDLGLEAFKGIIVAVTGTNGKSTTCKMIEHVLTETGVHAIACGNIGVPVTEVALSPTPYQVYVVEISSYQLQLSNIRPQVGIFTSFSFDHLGRHHSMERYFQTKWRLFTSPKETYGILNDKIVALAEEYSCPLPEQSISIDTFQPQGLKDLGYPVHDQWNAKYAVLATIWVMRKMGIDRSTIRLLKMLESYQGLPYRFQHIGTINGRRVINDSKSTNVESTLTALASCRRPVILFLGGQGKGEPYFPIKDYKQKIARVIAYGQSGNDIAGELRVELNITKYASLKVALNELTTVLSMTKEDILFSPACASFDEFNNFEHRGEFFTQKMQELGMISSKAKPR